MHEIYCSNEKQDATNVTLVTQDSPGDITLTTLRRSRHRLDNLDIGDKVESNKNLVQSSIEVPLIDIEPTENQIPPALSSNCQLNGDH